MEHRGISHEEIVTVLKQCLDSETELLKTYTIFAERIHEDEELQLRLRNFAEGNAKRTRQLADELDKYDA